MYVPLIPFTFIEFQTKTPTYAVFEPGSFSIGPWGRNRPESQLSPSSLSVGLTNAKRNGSGWTVQTTAGLANNQITADWSTPIPGGLKMKFGAELGLGQSIAGFITAEGKVTDNVKAGLILQMEIGGGIIMKVKYVTPFVFFFFLSFFFRVLKWHGI